MEYSVQATGTPPPFLNHTTSLWFKLADSTSTRPSPSTSAANTEWGVSAVAEMTYSVQLIGVPPRFLCQAILSSSTLAQSTSSRPSLSTSVTYNEYAR